MRLRISASRGWSFAREGVLRSSMVKDGELIDPFLYARVRKDDLTSASA